MDGFFRESADDFAFNDALHVVSRLHRDHGDAYVVVFSVYLIVDPWRLKRSKRKPDASRCIHHTPRGSNVTVSGWRFIKPRDVTLPAFEVLRLLFVGEDVESGTILKLPFDIYTKWIPDLPCNKAFIEPLFKKWDNDSANPISEVTCNDSPLDRPIESLIMWVPLRVVSCYMPDELKAAGGRLAGTVTPEDRSGLRLRQVERLLLRIWLIRAC